MTLKSQLFVLNTPRNVVDVYVGAQVRMRRVGLGLDAAAFADSLQLSDAELWGYESGHKPIGAGLLQKICEALKSPVSYFFEGYDLLPGLPCVLEVADQTKPTPQPFPSGA
jgi:transcriptional regulator with XRE-family HTH domain